MRPGSAVYRLGRKTRWDPYDNQRRRGRRKPMPKTISASFIFTSATRISGLAITTGPTFSFAQRLRRADTGPAGIHGVVGGRSLKRRLAVPPIARAADVP